MSRPPNVLCISVDSLRADHCGFLEDGLSTTPNLDHLATQSAVFTRAIAPSIWTLAVHASIFTGLYPDEHGVTDKQIQLGECDTFAQRLVENGYTAAAFGYNGWLEQGDILRGFEHNPTATFSGWERSLLGYPYRRYRDLKHAAFRLENKDKQTVSAVRDRLSTASSPFCFFVHLQGPHYKYHPHIDYYRNFGSLSTVGLWRAWQAQQRLFDSKINRYLDGWTPSLTQQRHIREMYDGSIREADRRIGEVLEGLQTHGLLENTVVVVFGDHGESFGEDGIFGHNFSLSDGIIRVPFLVFDPTETISEGVHDEVVQTHDLYPTLGDLCDYDVPDRNTVSLCAEQSRDSAFVHYTAADSMYDALESEVRTTDGVSVDEMPPRRWHAIWQSPKRKRVWNDPGWPTLDVKCDTLTQRFSDHLDALNAVPPQRVGEPSTQVRQNLEQMGYL